MQVGKIDNEKELIESVLKLDISDIGRYAYLCYMYSKPNRRKYKKNNFDKLINTSKRKSFDTYLSLKKLRLISTDDDNEIILNFNMLDFLGMKLDVNKLNLDFEDKYAFLYLGRILSLIILAETRNSKTIKKQDIRKIWELEKSSFARVLNKIKDTKYNNINIFEIDNKYITINNVYKYKGKRNCIYRFIGKNNEVLYVGKTKELIGRLRTHFCSVNTHLPKELYGSMTKIEYHSFGSRTSDMSIYEIYYINKYKPKYNKKDKGDNMTITLPELTWVEHSIGL